jgi:pilus assembly protein Flp/PilA
MNTMTFLKHIGNDNSGATAIEYGLIIACIALALVASLNAYAGEVNELWQGNEEGVVEALEATTPPPD